jgi:hypothetical protein
MPPQGWKLALRRSIFTMLFAACAVSFDALDAAAQESPTTDEAAATAAATNEESVEIAVPLLERTPFDRITLDAANQNAVIETVLLDFPERKVPNPLPTTGSLDIRRLSHPSIPYKVQWESITKVELFEQMLLAEAERLTAEGKFAEAFNYLAFLTTNYPQLPGLEQALQAHLWREASTAYAANKRQEAWPALVALYQRNAKYPRLVNAVQAVSDDLIAERIKEGDYAGARLLVEALARSFPQLGLPNIARWQGQFKSDADAQLARARQAFAAQDYSEARTAIAFSRAIMPDIPGGTELWNEIQTTSPEIRVGVSQLAEASAMATTPTWAVARVSDLVNPRLVEMVDFGAEGGVYQSRWSDLNGSDDGLRTTISLTPEAVERGLRPDALALRLIEMADVNCDRAAADFAALAAGVSLANGRDVEVLWRRPHVRPESFLQLPLRWLATANEAPGLWFDARPAKRDVERSFERTGPQTIAAGEPRLVVETLFADDEESLDALMRGDVDAIDRVPPWQLARVANAPNVTVVPYRLPTVHVLIPNQANPLLATREFRRALNYGIDAESIVRDILLAGETRAGFRTLSGPFPAGVALNDPGGYAYNPELAARPYEPRLAALLAGVARTTLAKREEEKKKAEADAKAKEEADAKAKELAANPPPPQAEGDADAAKEAPAPQPATNAVPDKAAADNAVAANGDAAEKPAPPPAPLILAHASDPVAKLACQTIKIQLDQIGIPVKLVEFKGGAPPADLKYDLLYAELAVWEPVHDARRLLGATGVAGRASAMMAAALDQLDRAENWNQARDQLREIHRIAHYDLPLIPLWQTVNHFAHRKSLSGVEANPVTLYQNLPQWRKSIE